MDECATGNRVCELARERVKGRSAMLLLSRVAAGDDAVAQLRHAREDVRVCGEGETAELGETRHHALAVGLRVASQLDEQSRECILFRWRQRLRYHVG